ncbi:5784_t:CDS:2, partial [Paraglomus occultum]
DNGLYKDEYDDSDTTVVGIIRVKIDQVKEVVLSDGLSGMGVRVFKVNSQGAANNEMPAYTASYVCGVHCVPVHNAKGQLIFDIFDKNLTAGSFSLPLGELMTRNADGLYNRKQLLEKSEQINIPGGVKCMIQLEAQFYSTKFESNRFDFSKDTVDINDLYRLIGMTFNAVAFDVSNKLALCFNFESASDLFHALTTRIKTDKQLMSDPLNEPESTGNGAPPEKANFTSISLPVYSLVPPKTKSKRVHKFEANGCNNKVISYTRCNVQEISSVGKFKPEPWVASGVRTAVMLDDRNDRVLFIGKHTIQLWSNFAEESKTLQYIWCIPITEQNRKKDLIEEYFIEWAELTKLSGEVFIIELKGSADTYKIRLPRKDAPASFQTVKDASYALGILNLFERESWADEGYQHYETLLDGCKSIIARALSSDSIESTDELERRGSRLKSIGDESERRDFPLKAIGGTFINDSKTAWSEILQVLMQFNCERTNTLTKELLMKKKITLTLDDFEEEKRMSDLSCAISLGRTDIVRLLLLYYCERATSVNKKSETNPDFENNLRIVVPEFGRLCEKHPDIALEL